MSPLGWAGVVITWVALILIVKTLTTTRPKRTVLSIERREDGTTMYVHFEDGSVYGYRLERESAETSSESTEAPLPWEED